MFTRSTLLISVILLLGAQTTTAQTASSVDCVGVYDASEKRFGVEGNGAYYFEVDGKLTTFLRDDAYPFGARTGPIHSINNCQAPLDPSDFFFYAPSGPGPTVRSYIAANGDDIYLMDLSGPAQTFFYNSFIDSDGTCNNGPDINVQGWPVILASDVAPKFTPPFHFEAEDCVTSVESLAAVGPRELVAMCVLIGVVAVVLMPGRSRVDGPPGRVQP